MNATTGDTRAGDSTAHADDRIETAEKMTQIVELRRQRWTFQRIGDELGHSRQHVHRLYERALTEIPAASVHLHRTEMLDQLDEAEATVLAVLHAKHFVVSNGHIVHEVIGEHPAFDVTGQPHPLAGKPIYGDPLVDHGPILDAARTLVALQARRAKLIGADAPIKTDLSGGVELNYTIRGVDTDKL